MTQILHDAKEKNLPARTRWAILAVVLAADVLDLLDATITNIAAPTITKDLGGGPGLVQWLGASYALALGVLLVPGGRLGDKYGRRRLFLYGPAGFVAASLACGLAPTPAALVLARLAQGACAALVIPQGFGILGATWPRDQIGKAFSLFGPVMGLSAVSGPILAGFLVDADIAGLGWRPMFLINLLLGGAALLAAVRLLPRDTGDPSVSVDGPGSALLASALLGLLGGLIDGSDHGWTPRAFVLLLLGLALFAGFCHRQRTAAHPLVQPSLLHNRGFTSGLILGIVAFAATAGLLYVISLFFQRGLGRSPSDTALGLIPLSLGIVIASIACYRLIHSYGRRLVVAGLLMILAGCGHLALLVGNSGTSVSSWALVPPVLVIGLGMGTCFGTVYDVTIGDIAPDEAGSASGSLNAVQQVANAIGAASVTTVYFHTADGGEAHAMTVSLVVVAAATLLCLPLVRLLPRKAPTEQHH
ncbi:MFS transporter [Streptomyces sp. MMG1533]|uniref:MFS transporter n=1 Tax=Streptomyces sp. MMG1533 TaxID=1415546 RepID=UPI0003C968C4|nr:MFS transporter [Streptomyces sp. MMG1533]AGZ94075.1 arabinose efflux permease family protein [Streptomyces sp. MMG1533]